MNPESKQIMLPKEVSAFLRIPLATVYYLSKKGVIPARKIGKHWRYLKHEVETLMEEKPCLD